MNDIRAQLRRQLELEDEGRALGIARYHSRDLPWKGTVGSPEEEANLPPGQKLLQEATLPTAAAIAAFVADASSGKAGKKHSAVPYLILSEPLDAAYLTLRVLVNAAAGQAMLQTVSAEVARAVRENLAYEGLRLVNNAGYKGLLNAQKRSGYSRQRKDAVRKLFDAEGVLVAIPDSDLILVGSKLIELAIEATGLFVVEKQSRRRGYHYVIRASETFRDWLDKQHARCALLTPVNMPMIVRPRRWKSPFYGGYLRRTPGNRLVKQRNVNYHDELRAANPTRVYAAVNHIQEVPWRINRRVLDVMEVLLDGGGDVAGLPAMRDEPIPEKPEDIDTNEDAKLQWKRAAAAAHATNASRVADRLTIHQRLWVARKFAEEQRIYFPHNLDFRGRVYPIPVAGPHPQGDDICKGLLTFADGKPLGETGARWLRIHIANLFGVDKVSFDERDAWVYDNASAILDSATDPLDGQRFWMTADSPFMALAACIEWADSLEAAALGREFVSHLPVALDGSNSGLQHFSAMLRDPVGARAVNLEPGEKPQDVYSEVAQRAQEVADRTPTITYTERVEGVEVDRTIPNPWRGGKITRTIAKRPTMTYCYSSTRFGMQGMIHQTLREIDRDNERHGLPAHLGGADNYHCAVWLSHVIHAAIGASVSAASQAMDWLRAAAKVAASDGLPLWWTTPMGLPILQEYREATGTRVKAHWAGQCVKMVVAMDGNKLCARSQQNGVAPNFIHSFDASHLMAVAEAAKASGLNHLAVIHDSFGTHAADTNALADILRTTFVAQYTPDVLGNFHREFSEQLPEELREQLPAPPLAGSFDLNQVLRSSYVFA